MVATAASPSSIADTPPRSTARCCSIPPRFGQGRTAARTRPRRHGSNLPVAASGCRAPGPFHPRRAAVRSLVTMTPLRSSILKVSEPPKGPGWARTTTVRGRRRTRARRRRGMRIEARLRGRPLHDAASPDRNITPRLRQLSGDCQQGIPPSGPHTLPP